MTHRIKQLTFTLPYPPTANKYWRNVNGRMVVSADARAYKEDVGWRLKLKIKEPLPGDVYVKVRIFRPRKIGDLDNTLKVLLDALKGIVFFDDDQVVEIRANRFDDKANPRAEVSVEVRQLIVDAPLSPGKRAVLNAAYEKLDEMEKQ